MAQLSQIVESQMMVCVGMGDDHAANGGEIVRRHRRQLGVYIRAGIDQHLAVDEKG
jgi:hypothetical protein